ncbi:MAG: sn-glycerol-3-phosphate ABC transporter ATP-binding protein UgpC [Clostridiales bacterium]|nr:sn-glycerol-3-phosphate ABC transporter ATP-binding protein UgpC [Clostridiales bacterium]
MANIELCNVSKIYENHNCVVKDFNLSIKDKEFVIFVGPSGCGKSTTLRMIAGLEEISDGELWIDGKLCNYTEPGDRGLSMVFQNYALYPNMNVFDNMAFSLKIRNIPKNEIKQKVEQVAKILEIEQLLKRRPKELSGGQRQRVAIGSAIVRNPKAFLMDEPLSNLDAKLRAQMRIELAKIHKELGTTIIYVTHDQTEAMTLGTRIVVMKKGEIQQADTPTNLYQCPANVFVAGFIGSPAMNFFPAYVGQLAGKAFLHLDNNVNGTVLTPVKKIERILKNAYLGKKVIVGIRPEDIYEYEDAKERGFDVSMNVIEAVVDAREMLGSEVILHFEFPEGNFAARVGAENQNYPGDAVKLYFDVEKLHIFDKETEKNILFIL